jgi:hypothetical protein
MNGDAAAFLQYKILYRTAPCLLIFGGRVLEPQNVGYREFLLNSPLLPRFALLFSAVVSHDPTPPTHYRVFSVSKDPVPSLAQHRFRAEVHD